MSRRKRKTPDKWYKVMKVKADSDSIKVAGASAEWIRKVEREYAEEKDKAIKAGQSYDVVIDDYCELSCIAASSNYAGIKAAAITNGMLAPTGLSILIDPLFTETDVKGVMKTAMRLILVKS